MSDLPPPRHPDGSSSSDAPNSFEILDDEEIRDLPPEIVEIRREVALFEATSGSMPPPSMLARYNNVADNGADRIMVMAENQQQHRIDIEKKVVNSDAAIREKALYLGFALVTLTIVGGVILAICGLEIFGGLLATAGVVSSGLAYFKGLASKEERMSRK